MQPNDAGLQVLHSALDNVSQDLLDLARQGDARNRRAPRRRQAGRTPDGASMAADVPPEPAGRGRQRGRTRSAQVSDQMLTTLE